MIYLQLKYLNTYLVLRVADSRNGRIFELIFCDKTFFHFKFDKGFIKLALEPLSGYFQVAFHQIRTTIFHTLWITGIVRIHLVSSLLRFLISTRFLKFLVLVHFF